MNHFLFLLLFSTLLSTTAFSQGIPRDRIPVTIKQPDSTSLQIIGKGSSCIPYTETIDGYTLKRNSNDVYEYAMTNLSGDLVPSGVKANDAKSRKRKEKKYLKKVTKHLAYTGEKLEQMKNACKNAPNTKF